MALYAQHYQNNLLSCFFRGMKEMNYWYDKKIRCRYYSTPLKVFSDYYAILIDRKNYHFSYLKTHPLDIRSSTKVKNLFTLSGFLILSIISQNHRGRSHIIKICH